MRLSVRTIFGLLPLFVGLQVSHAAVVRQSKAADSNGITTDDIKAGYERVAARYASWAERKKQGASRSDAVYGQLKLASAKQETEPPVVRQRGTVMNLIAVGGYPEMLGQTYNAAVAMGTPAQLFNLTADTGSMLTWAVQASCKQTDCPGVASKNTYDPTKSTTSKPLRSDHEAYGDGEMDLMLYTDVVGLDKLQAQTTIGGANKTFEKDGKLEHDGLLGLGRKLAADPEPVLDSLAKQDKAFRQIVALDLGPQASVEIGGYDFTTYPKMVHYQVTVDEGWLLTNSSIRAQGAAKMDPVELLLDTGSSVSMLPASQMDAIMNRAGLKVQKSKDEPITYSMACDTKLNVQMILPDGTKVPVPDKDILMQSNDPKMPGCLSLLVGTTNPFLPAVAGTPILKSIYTVLSKTDAGDWIGLAPLQSQPAQPHQRRRHRAE